MTVGALVGVYQFNTNDIGESEQPYENALSDVVDRSYGAHCQGVASIVTSLDIKEPVLRQYSFFNLLSCHMWQCIAFSSSVVQWIYCLSFSVYICNSESPPITALLAAY